MAVVDFHSHILPGADHGSSSVSTSLIQLSLAAHAGVDKIIATPHFYPHLHAISDFLARRATAYRHLMTALSENPPSFSPPVVRLGAEVLLCRGIENLPGFSDLCFYGTKTVLLELPFNEFSLDFCDSAEVLRDRGYRIVLAHADRYAEKNIEEMVGVGALIQLNANSLTGFFRRKQLFDWVERELVVAIGSDIHGENAAAYRDFRRAERVLGAALPRIAERSLSIFNEIVEYPIAKS
ncbi:MAG TPA: hypothetical protein DDY70_01955 [Clostridiales bacterium]|nr:hypothetical protein [Clostridiales bacterium]